MAHTAASVYRLRLEDNPVVGRLAEEIRLASLDGDVEDRWRGLMEEVLEYAAEAEQRISAQSERIFFLENLTETDELTGLLNRRGFNKALKRVLANASRHGEQGLLVYMDLDGFKPVNDAHGHAAGDAILRAAARALKGASRTTDYVARLGGDEFALLLVRADTSSAEDISAKLRTAVEKAEAVYGGDALSVSASLGWAPYGAGTDAAELMKLADAHMYRDKQRDKIGGGVN